MNIHLTLVLPELKGIQESAFFWAGWVQSDLDRSGIKGKVFVSEPTPVYLDLQDWHAAFIALRELREAANEYANNLARFKAWQATDSEADSSTIWRAVSASHLKLQTLRDRHGV